MLIQLQSVTLFLVAEIQNKINDIMIFMSTCIFYETVHFLRIALVIILKESLRQASISIHRSLKQKRTQNQQRPRSWLSRSKQSMSFKAFILYTWKAVQLFFVQEYVAILLLFVRQINWEGKIAVLRIHIPYSKSVVVRFRIERLKEWFDKYLSSRGPNGFAKVL